MEQAGFPSMNPLFFKAHPLLYATLDLLVNPQANSLEDFSRLILLYLGLNVLWALALRQLVQKTAGFSPSYPLAFLMGLPALVVLLPTMTTVLADVLRHEFFWADRFILVFAIFLAIQMLGAWYGASLKDPRSGKPIGLRAGFVIALGLLLLAMPYGLLFIVLNGVFKLI
jgi:hypothetical protein